MTNSKDKDFTFIRCRVPIKKHAKFKARCAELQIPMEDAERALISWWLTLPDDEAIKYSESLQKEK